MKKIILLTLITLGLIGGVNNSWAARIVGSVTSMFSYQTIPRSYGNSFSYNISINSTSPFEVLESGSTFSISFSDNPLWNPDYISSSFNITASNNLYTINSNYYATNSGDSFGTAQIFVTTYSQYTPLTLSNAPAINTTLNALTGTFVPAPEPSTYALLSLGIIGTLLAVRRRHLC